MEGDEYTKEFVIDSQDILDAIPQGAADAASLRFKLKRN